MNIFIWFLIIIAIISFLKYIEYIITREKIAIAYRKKEHLMTKAELEFFRVLELVIKNQYYIVPQLPISKIATTIAKGKDYYTYLNKIDRKTVDFVLFDRQSFSPVMVIELDDSSHNDENRKIRDGFVDNVMKNIGLKIIHVKTSYAYSTEELNNLIFGLENNINAEQSEHEKNQIPLREAKE